MASLEREIDQLYQRPLAEFTAARKDLAKRESQHRAAINRLPKPNVAAWAVNQVYWTERKTYDALVTASERLRAAQAAMLKGGSSNVAPAEAAHAKALKAASQSVREVLHGAGEAASPATMNAVHETLQALPGNEPAGRLTRPLKPLGFEALSGLLKGKLPVRRATVLAFKPQTNAALEKADHAAAQRAAADAKRAAEAARREAGARKKEVATLERELRRAQAAEEHAAMAVTRARGAVEKAEQDLQRRRDEAGAVTANRREIETRLRTLH